MGLKLIILIAAIALLSLSVERASCDRDQVNCFYCAPDSSNNMCTTPDKVTQQINCPSGRCLVLGAHLSATGKVARFFTCDTHNIVDWALQVVRYPAETVDVNKCGWLETKDDEAITMLREYGLLDDIKTLLQGTLPASAAAVSASTDSMEICTCEGKMCNSPDAQLKWTLLPTSGDSGQSLQPRRAYINDDNKNENFAGKERAPPSSGSRRLSPRIGFGGENEHERLDRYMNENKGRDGEKVALRSLYDDKTSFQNDGGETHHHPTARMVRSRAGNAPSNGDNWWYWFLIILSTLLVLGAVYLFYRIASAPMYSGRHFDRTIETRTHEHVEAVPLQAQS